jgi:uncharacterized iron-regulated membrane protein
MLQTKKRRDLIFFTHRYLGLVLGILIAIAGLTGSTMIILNDTQEFFITQGIEAIIPQDQRLPLEVLVEKAKAARANQGYTVVNGVQPYAFPNHPQDSPTVVSLSTTKNLEDYVDVLVNPYTGEVLGEMPPRTVYDFMLNLHYALLAGRIGEVVMGITGLLGFILATTGIALWPGWRKLSTGFKIKWKGHLKRRNFDLHKVAGLFSGIFLSLALITGFIYNFPQFANPLLYRMTFSPVPPEEFVSKPIADKVPITLAQALAAIDRVMPEGIFTQIDIPQKPEDVYQVRKKVPGDWYGNPTWGRSFAHVDRYSGKVLSAVNITKASLGEKVVNGMDIVHFGLFGGLFGRALYFYVGLMPTFLLVTGFIMWWHRKRTQPASVFQLHRKPDKSRV